MGTDRAAQRAGPWRILVSDGRQYFLIDDSLTAYWVKIRQHWFEHHTLLLYNDRKKAFTDRLAVLKPKVDLISVTAVVTPSKAECSGAWINGADGLLSTGDLYMETATQFKGRIIPICRDFAAPLTELGADLVKFLSRFKLKQKPDGQVQVIVNSKVVARDEVNGWAYLSETNEVEFRGDAIPASDAKIEVIYVPGEPLR